MKQDSNSLPDISEKHFTANGLEFSARYWAKGGATDYPVIALHGWLDNCNSFQPLAETLSGPQYLPNISLLALDLAGHGRSDHRSADSAYNLWQDVDEVLQIADQMGWRRFSLLGHSRGAMISVLLAAVAPERVDRLALIDGLVPIPVTEEDAPQQLAKAVADRQKYRRYHRRRYSTLEEAAAVRLRGAFPLTLQSARLIAKRGVAMDDEGFYWVADPRLQGASDVKFSDGQLRAFLKQVASPVVLFLGEKAIDLKEQLFASYWEELQNCRKFIFKGGHHLHMEEAQSLIAEQLAHFFKGMDAEAG